MDAVISAVNPLDASEIPSRRQIKHIVAKVGQEAYPFAEANYIIFYKNEQEISNLVHNYGEYIRELRCWRNGKSNFMMVFSHIEVMSYDDNVEFLADCFIIQIWI